MHLIPDNIDYSKYAKQMDGQHLKPASSWEDAVIDRFASKSKPKTGAYLPWEKAGDDVLLRPGELSLWAGINGHGKSLAIGQVMAWLLPYAKVAIASMEMPPPATMQRMIRQVAGTCAPTVQLMRRFMKWTDDRLWIYDQHDSVASDKILGMVRYAIQELGINHIVIDSLLKCGIAPDDYARQKQFVDRLCWSVRHTQAHIHLVVHMRKGRTEDDIPDKFDVKGAGEIVDLADNLFIVHRNKGKESRRDKGEDVQEFEPDATIDVSKQRHGEWEGRLNLYWHANSQQLIGSPNHPAIPYPENIFDGLSPEDSYLQ